jgi:hypothetical protein
LFTEIKVIRTYGKWIFVGKQGDGTEIIGVLTIYCFPLPSIPSRQGRGRYTSFRGIVNCGCWSNSCLVTEIKVARIYGNGKFSVGI